jgi:hypothetical protein
MTNNTSISVVALDFATLRNSLKTYLQSQDAFRDYDFDGSNMSVLLDILSYNTFHNAFYLNMLASELFLDSALMRDSIISHAKELNYTPRSNLSSRANVNITITTNDGSKGVVIPQYTTFTGRIGSNTFTFSTNTATIAVSNTNVISAENVDIYEGLLNSDQFIVDSSNTAQKFILSNPDIDTSSVSVTVVEDGGSRAYSYQQTYSLFDLTANSQVFFIQGAFNGKYELIFGDNVNGRRPKDGGVVVATYRISTGDAPNNISIFSVDGSIDGHSNVIVTINQNSSGGAYAESTESIRFNAPRHFTTQERCVTADDYEILLLEEFPEILDVSAVGGETLDPPQYGKVSITVALDGITGLPESKQKQFYDFLAPRSPLSITPIFNAADYLYVGVDATVNYNFNATSVDPSYIETLVFNQISNYNTTAIDGFKKTLRYSQLVRVIDLADSSIVSNSTDLKMIKRIVPTLGLGQNWNFSFSQELSTSIDTTISSDVFIYQNQSVKLMDDENGVINLVSTSNAILYPVGTVNYETGQIYLTNLLVDLLTTGNDYLQIFAISKSKDISSIQNVILTIDTNNVNITVNPIRL